MTDKHTPVKPNELATVPPQSIALMHPVVEKMLAQNPTPETLREILALQREWEHDQAKRAYDAALVELKKSLPPYLIRDKTVDFTSAKGRTHYTHTSLAGAMETVTPLLSDLGFSLTWKPGSDDKGQVTVTAKLTHRQGHYEESTLKAAPDATGNKNGPQAVASTVTLLARYACLGLLGLATADMTEPKSEESPDEPNQGQIDSARNLRAMADLQKSGKTREDIEQHVGKPVQKWTAEDLDKLRAWVDPKPQEPAPEQPMESSPLVTDDQVKAMRALLKEFKLTPEQFASLIEGELGVKPRSAKDTTQHQFATIMKAFGLLRKGEYSMKDGRFDKPPQFAAELPEDRDIPF